jgi:hypothetical protein
MQSSQLVAQKTLTSLNYFCWHAVWTILKGPLVSFLSTSHPTHLPSHSPLWHRCRELNALVLPWLIFASRSLLEIFIKVGSLVTLLLSTSLHMFRRHRGSMLQQDYSSSDHNIFYVKPSMSKTPNLWFHVLESISNIMNIWPRWSYNDSNLHKGSSTMIFY